MIDNSCTASASGIRKSKGTGALGRRLLWGYRTQQPIETLTGTSDDEAWTVDLRSMTIVYWTLQGAARPLSKRHQTASASKGNERPRAVPPLPIVAGTSII